MARTFYLVGLLIDLGGICGCLLHLEESVVKVAALVFRLEKESVLRQACLISGITTFMLKLLVNFAVIEDLLAIVEILRAVSNH